MDSPGNGTPGRVGPSAGHTQSGGRRRGSSSSQGVEGQEEADDESSSSSLTPHEPEPMSSVLEDFRKKWEDELKAVGGGSSGNPNSALNLVTASSASLSNPYPNPTSMAGAVSKSRDVPLNESPDKSHPHPLTTSKPSKTLDNLAYESGLAEVEVPSTGSIDEQARRWFLQGVGLERHGDLYDAVRCYRKAVQLVPDIEYKISQGMIEEGKKKDDTESDDDSDTSDDNGEDDNVEEYDGSEEDTILLKRFLKQIEQRGWLFINKTLDTDKGHISDLPVEVLTYILRWVVSTELDVRSLDILSSVCKGFYCIARDDQIWQMACNKVWTSAILDTTVYDTYRDMFLRRPRVRLDGCYISKITYIRAGEQSFQDQFYRPWHFVEYYRYLRFFPDGEVLFLTCSEDPVAALPLLRDKNHPRNSSVLKGLYNIYGNNVAAVVKPLSIPSTPGFSRGKKADLQKQQTSFHIELEICSTRSRHNCMLKWIHHAVFITKPVLGGRPSNVASTSLELIPTKYPPLLFSRVKSYTGKAEKILE